MGFISADRIARMLDQLRYAPLGSLASVIVATACLASQSFAVGEETIVLRAVTLVDVERGRLVANRDIAVRGHRIVGIQAGGTTRVPARGREIDARGKFAIPGLWDFHVHVFSAPGEEDIALPLYIVNGVTGIRDAGGLRTRAEMQQVVDAVARGERVGPRIVLGGALIDGPPGSWPNQMVARNPDEGRARVREAHAEGWRYIKSYSLLSRSTYLAIADEARKYRLPLFGHIPETVTLLAALAAGHRSIEHFGRLTQACSTAEAQMVAANTAALASAEPFAALMRTMAGHNQTTLANWDRMVCERTLATLARSGTMVMPSLMISDFYLGKDPTPDDVRLRSIPGTVRAQWAQGDWRRQQMPPELRAIAPQSVALDWKTFKLAHAAGVTMLAGTDASFANPFIFHGFTLHDELARYVEAGLTPRDALATATVSPGRFLKLRDLSGRIAVGQRADIVLLDANPHADIAAIRQIHAVIANGRLYDRMRLDELRHEIETAAAR
jgi:imidazolonepropionase-like amidohydrolase